MIRLFVFLLIYPSFIGFTQKSNIYFGYSLEYKDSVFYLLEPDGTLDSIGVDFNVHINRFKQQLDSCESISSSDKELILRIIKMYLPPNHVGPDRYTDLKAPLGRMAFFFDCFHPFLIKQILQNRHKIKSCFSTLGKSRKEALEFLNLIGYRDEEIRYDGSLILFNKEDGSEVLQLVIIDEHVSRVRFLSTDENEIDFFKIIVLDHSSKGLVDGQVEFPFCPKSTQSEPCEKLVVFGELVFDNQKYKLASYGYRN